MMTRDTHLNNCRKVFDMHLDGTPQFFIICNEIYLTLLKKRSRYETDP